MQRYILSIVCAALMGLGAQSAAAQEAPRTKAAKAADYAFRPHWELGIVAGMGSNHTEINTHYAYDYVYTDMFGFNAGISALWQPKEWFGIRIDAAYIRKNLMQSRVQTATQMFVHADYNGYFQMPVMADFSFGGSRWRGHFDLGLFFGYWHDGETMGAFDAVDDGIDYFDIYTFDEPYAFDPRHDRRFEMGYAASVGLSRRCGKHLRLQGELALYYGLTSTKAESAVVNDPVYNTTKVFNLNAYWVF